MTTAFSSSSLRSSQGNAGHIPVLLREVLDMANPQPRDVWVDGTFGRGGYTRALLDQAPDIHVWAFDRDGDAVAYGRQEVELFYPSRFHLIHGCFSTMKEALSRQGISAVDGVVLDLGVSSPQIDTPERGFSFREDGPLDMRFHQEGLTAAQVVNTLEEKELADVLYTLGDERFSRRIARKIAEVRTHSPLTTTQELAALVRSVVPRSADGLDPATRTFQALRLYVNDELGALSRGLEQAEALLKAGGRLVVVSFHSLEDRRVKTFLRDRSQILSKQRQAGGVSRHHPGGAVLGNPLKDREDGMFEATFEILTRRPLRPSALDCRANPRASSGRLRAARRLGHSEKRDPAP